MLGILAVNYEVRPIDWPDGPVYVAEGGALTQSECRGWQSRAQRRHAAGFPGSWEAYEGFSRLQGACHPKDAARGRAMIEAAIAKGAGRYLMVEYVMALRAAGDYGRAEQFLPLATETMRFLLETQIAIVLSGRLPIVYEAMNEIDALDRSLDWRSLQLRLDTLLARPALLPAEESAQITRLISRMSEVDNVNAMVQADRAWRTGRYRSSIGDTFLAVAAACGHPEAIRRRVHLLLAGELPAVRSWSIMSDVMWLDSRTGSEGELLAAIERRFAFLPGPQDHAAAFEHRNRWIATRCHPRPARDR